MALLGGERIRRHRDVRRGRVPPLRQLGLPHRRRLLDRDLAGLRGPAAAAGGRVLLADPLRDHRDDGHGRRPRPDGDLPGPRAHVDRRLRPGRLQPARPPQRGSGPQVFPARRLRQRLPPLRHRADLRSDRQRQHPFGGRRHTGRRGPGGTPGSWGGAARDRVRLQGRRRALPHVDPGRLRRGPHTRHRVHGRGRQGGRLRRLPARVRGGARRRLRPVVERPVVARGDHDGGRQRDRARAVQRQAHAGLLLDRARGLPPGGARGRQRHGRGRAPVLPAGLHGDEHRGVRDRAVRGQPVRAEPRDRELHRFRVAQACHGHDHDGVPALAGRVPGHRGLHRQVQLASRRRRSAAVGAVGHPGSHDGGLLLVLPARGLVHVDEGSAGRDLGDRPGRSVHTLRHARRALPERGPDPAGRHLPGRVAGDGRRFRGGPEGLHGQPRGGPLTGATDGSGADAAP